MIKKYSFATGLQFVIRHNFADWGNAGQIWRKALELLRLMSRIGIKAKMCG